MSRGRQAPITVIGGRLVERYSARSVDLEGGRPLRLPAHGSRRLTITAIIGDIPGLAATVDSAQSHTKRVHTVILEDGVTAGRSWRPKGRFGKQDFARM
jgi:hypothetical protein